MKIIEGHDNYRTSNHCTQKMKFSFRDFFSKCDQVCSLLRIWSQLLKKSLTEYFTFCAVNCTWATIMGRAIVKEEDNFLGDKICFNVAVVLFSLLHHEKLKNRKERKF